MGQGHKLKIEFLGAARTVTGSRTRVTYDNTQFIVDCGLFQGPRERRMLNWEPFPDIEKLNFAVLTHAHIDHSGYLPKIAKDGFRGPVYCSEATYKLCQIMLKDSAHLQEEDAKFLGSRNLSRHKPPKPLYTTEHAEMVLKQFNPIKMNEWIEVSPGISIKLVRAGHILGSTFVQMAFERSNGVQIMTFSGDLGTNDQYVVKGPDVIDETDFLVLEGTYGNRSINRQNTLADIEKIANETFSRGGTLVIPAFAVGRTQELLHIFSVLKKQKKIPDIKIYVDSPMANNVTQLFNQHISELKPFLKENELSFPVVEKSFKAVQKLEDSIALCGQGGPIIVISASGMLSGGRILHHLKSRLSNPNNTILFVGYQAEETKGRLLQSGLKTIRLHKEQVDVSASIQTIEGLSAHADSDEIIEWVSNFKRGPKKIFLNHGNYEALRSLQYRLRTELGLKSKIPQLNESFEL